MILLSLNGDNFSNDIYHAGVTADATFWLHDVRDECVAENASSFLTLLI